MMAPSNSVPSELRDNVQMQIWLCKPFERNAQSNLSKGLCHSISSDQDVKTKTMIMITTVITTDYEYIYGYDFNYDSRL